MPEDWRGSFGDPRVWDSLIARMAERLADNLVAEIGDSVLAQVKDGLDRAAGPLHADLADQTARLHGETSRAITVLRQMEEGQAALQAVVDSIAPGVTDATGVALTSIEDRLGSQTDHLLAMFSGRYMMIDRARLDTLLGHDDDALADAIADLESTLGLLARIGAQTDALALAQRPVWSRLRGEGSAAAERIAADIAESSRLLRSVTDRLNGIRGTIDELSAGGSRARDEGER